MNLTASEKKERDFNETYYKSTCEEMKKVLFGKVKDVTLSHRLQTSPCCLVSADFGWTANMERIMSSQALRNDQMSQFMKSQKTLELNPTHGIIEHLRHLWKTRDLERFNELTRLLYGISILNSGFMHPDPVEFASRLYHNLPIRERGDNPDLSESDEEDNDIPALDETSQEQSQSSLEASSGDPDSSE